MAVDETGEDCFSGSVDYLGIRVDGADLGGGREGGDAAALNGDGGVVEDGAAGSQVTMVVFSMIVVDISAFR